MCNVQCWQLLSGILKIICVCTLVVLTAGCDGEDEIVIGYVGGLTGRVADLGIAGRDGVILAVEQKNAAGGIHGKQIQLIIKDDQQDSSIAVDVDRQLVEEGAVAIVGHMTSSMSVAGAKVANEHQVVMISPTTSTNELTGQDDYFFRVYPASAQGAKRLAEHVAEKMNVDEVLVIYDQRNKAHTYSYYVAFRNAIESHGKRVSGALPFESGQGMSFTELGKEIAQNQPQCLLILASAMDTAMICQQLAKMKISVPMVASEWSASDKTLEFGGRSVEGLFFFNTFDRLNEKPDWLEFKQAFIDRFGHEPDFASCHSYDATQILFKAMARDRDFSKLSQVIRSIGVYDGLQTEIRLDEFGDVKREHFSFSIDQGAFVKR